MLGAVVLLAPPSGAEDWPQFRGPRGDGTSRAVGLPLTWNRTQPVAWKTFIPGRGHSSPVVCGDRIWLTAADDAPATPETRAARLRNHPDAGPMYVAEDVLFRLLCLDRFSGRIIYDVELFHAVNPDPVHRLNSFATPTPVVEEGFVYCDFGTFGTACVAAQAGRIVWKAKLPVEHVLGPASSPVLCGRFLLLVRDGADTQYVAALDKQTGRLVWKTSRPPMDADTPFEKKAYSTPLVVESAGQRQAIVPGAQWVCSYDPETGREFWRIRHGKGFSVAPRPVAGHGMVYISTGCNQAELLALRIDGRGDVTDTHIAWRAKEQVPTMSSPLLVGDEVYCVSDRGVVSCWDAHRGTLQWRHRIGGNYLASPIYAEGRLYFFSWEGKTTVLQAGRKYLPLAENELDGNVAATPAVASGSLVIRTDRFLCCVAASSGQSGSDGKIHTSGTPRPAERE
jgi:outer membrane protein assembly factor BamB